MANETISKTTSAATSVPETKNISTVTASAPAPATTKPAETTPEFVPMNLSQYAALGRRGGGGSKVNASAWYSVNEKEIARRLAADMKVPAQVTALLGVFDLIMTDKKRYVFNEKEIEDVLKVNGKELLHTKQDPFRIFSYYRTPLLNEMKFLVRAQAPETPKVN